MITTQQIEHLQTDEPVLSRATVSSTIIKKTIRYVSAGCGSGKTHALTRHIKNNTHNSNHLYVAPTTKMIEQTMAEFVSIGVAAKTINSETNSGNVKKEIMKHFDTADSIGNVLLITWAAYSELPNFSNKSNWEIYIDEIPQIDCYQKFTIPYNRHFLSDHLEVARPINEHISLVKPKDAESLKKHLKNACAKDSITKQFKKTFSHALTTNHDLFVDTLSWTNICESKIISDNQKDNTVYLLSMLNPNLLTGTTLLGANIEKSMLYAWMTRYHSVNFEQHYEITSSLRGNTIDPSRLRITYFLDDKLWSKSIKKKAYENNTYCGHIQDYVTKEFADTEYLLIDNNDQTHNPLEDMKNCNRIPVISKGVNDYQHINAIVNLAALNRAPKYVTMLEQLGISQKTINESTPYEVLYQNLMRTSLRNPDSTEIVDLITPSRYEADFMVELIGDGVTMKKAGELNFKKYKALTPQQKNDNLKANKVTKILLAELEPNNLFVLPEINDHLYIDNSINSHQNLAIDNNKIKSNDQSVTICININLHDKSPSQFGEFTFPSFNEFAKEMHTLSKKIVTDKNDSLLINPIRYHVNDDGKYRLQNNFRSANMLALDFDGGTFTQQDFIDTFSDKAGRGQKRSFIITNSFSNSPLKPNRFRVYMAYKNPATTYSEHKAVFESIYKALLDKTGLTPEELGCDRSAANGTQPFRAPCTNRDYPNYAFFESRNTDKKGIERHGIDPSSYLKTSIIDVDRTNVVEINDYRNKESTNKQIDPLKIQQILNKVAMLPEGRYHPFFDAGVQLFYMGLPIYEIENHLKDLEKRIGKEKKRWADGAMKSIKKYNRRAA